VKSAVTISTTPQARSGPFVFHNGLADGCQVAAELGFDAVEIFPPAANAIDEAELQGLLDRRSLKVAAIGTGAGWVIHKWSLTSADAEARHRARDFIRAIIDVAAGFGAPAIIGSMQGRVEGDVTREQALAWLAEGLEELGEHAASHGQPLLYEFLNRYETNLFNRVAPTVDFLHHLKTRGVQILADLFHMNIEEANLAEALRVGRGWIGHVHFADSNRLAIGLGHTKIEPIIAALHEIGYQGYLSAEIFPLPDALGAARQTIESFRRCQAS
jgi:sugar phosphate isomerase/epimerase